MRKHVNIPIFIPHLGCPNQCVFCNQRTISGVDDFYVEDVKKQIETVLSTIDDSTEVEIAFFGGSFTGIDRDLMIALLELAHSFLLTGRVSSIRCSTRPDYISDGVLDILERYGMKTIELGLQSCNDNVLERCKRGHFFADELKACRLIVDRGFDLVGQMMIGLPGATLDDELSTAKFIVDSGASAVRIYPTIVFKNTELHQMTMDGDYSPLGLDDAVYRTSAVLKIFLEHEISVLRIGLCSSDNLVDESKYYAGPNHAAIGELVMSEVYYSAITQKIQKTDANKSDYNLIIHVSNGSISKAVGHGKVNKIKLIRDFGYRNIRFLEDSKLKGYQLEVEERKVKCT